MLDEQELTKVLADKTPDPDLFPPGKIAINAIFSKTFDMLFRNPVFFFGLSFIAASPLLVVSYLGTQGIDISSIITPFMVVLMLVYYGTISYGVIQIMDNRKVSLFTALRKGLSRFPVLFITGVIVGAGQLVGKFLFIVPGIYLECIWYVAIPVCVVERLGPVKSIQRSRELVQGNGWSVFALVATMFVIEFAYNFAVKTATDKVNVDNAVYLALLIAIFGAAFEALGGVLKVATYHDLRVIKEGASSDELAEVFA